MTDFNKQKNSLYEDGLFNEALGNWEL